MTVLSLDEQRQKNRAKAKRHYDKQRVVTDQGFRCQCTVCGDEFFARKRDVKVCGEGGCAKVVARQRYKPFTVEHFEKWASGVILDNGKPWKLERFHKRFIADLFSGFRELWLLIGEGNTKTTTLGGIALYHCQFRRLGRVPIAAASRDQAFEMYLQMQVMVESSPALWDLFKCHEGQRQIKCDSMSSRAQIFSADDRTGDGVIFTLALIDELHRARDLRLYRTWVGKTEKRGGQVAGISTAGDPGSDFELTRARIRQTATDRKTDEPGYLRAASKDVVLHEYACPPESDVEDMKNVKLANPFSGITLTSLKRKRKSPTMTISHWKRFTCNIATRDINAAILEQEWFDQVTSIEIPVGVPIYCGLDVAWKNDTTALAPLWVRDMSFRLFGKGEILVPPGGGQSLDPHKVEDALLQTHDRNPIHTLVMDTIKAEQLAAWAAENLGCTVIDRGQSNAHAALDYERWMEGIREGSIYHPGDADCTRHVLNAVARPLPSDKTRFDRPMATRGGPELAQAMRVIDWLTAAAMANTQAVADLMEPEEPQYRVAGFS